MGKGVEMNK